MKKTMYEINPVYFLPNKKIEQKHIGEEIERLLSKGWDCEKISQWAERLLITFIDHSEIYKILDRLSLMSAGPEFEYTIDELHEIAELLMNDFGYDHPGRKGLGI